jgi:hypothetical protein
VAARRADILVGLGAAVLGVGSAALEQADVAGWLAGAVVGGALALARSSPRAAWVTAAVALFAAAPFGPLPAGVSLLAVVHAFCAGRGDGRWWGVAGLIAIVAGLELDAFFRDDGSGVPALLLPGAAWGGGRALRERELVAAQLAERARELEE